MAASVAALSLSASASPAAASVTIGQLGSPSACGTGFEFVQPTVTSGNSYVIPAVGTITSWSHNTGPPAGQAITVKIWRPVTGATYTVVGHDGPRPLTGGTLNTFPANIAVKPGDVLGLRAATGDPGCLFSAPGELTLSSFGDRADGQPATFDGNIYDFRVNISAVLVPTNAFTLGKATRNKNGGTATLRVNVPNPGELSLAGKGLRKASAAGAVVAKTVSAGTVKLKIRARGKKKAKLNETGRVKVRPNITYTPTGGDPATQSRTLKLRKR